MIDKRKLVARLVAWYRGNKRDLPWRNTSDPYAIWVSEVMLQQTTVAAVKPFYERFLAAFPTVAALAEADEQHVLKHWAGLGYYSRCRNLHAAAKEMVARFGGQVPDTVEDLLSLPGVGRYTAGAVASFAHNRRAPILDTNVARVLARLFRVDGDPREPAASKRLWELAESLVPARDPGEFNHAVMELGATVCSPASPMCLLCPVREMCGASAAGNPTGWPQLRPKRKGVEVREVAAVVVRGDRILVARRKPGDLWAGMWECPRGEMAAGESPEAAAVRVVAEKLKVPVTPAGPLPTIKHGVTFRSITLECRLCRAADDTAGTPAGYADLRWVTPAEAAELPHSSPQGRLLRNLARAGRSSSAP